MKTLLLGATLCALSAPACALHVNGYSLPDPQAYGAGQIDGYSYYDGPVTLHIDGQPDITAYCADLNHWLHAQDYHFGALTENGLGQAIDIATSWNIGRIAQIGFSELGMGDGQYAAAAQLAIWSLLYPGDPVTNFASQTISDDFDLLMKNAKPPKTGFMRAEVLIPDGNWPADYGLSQQMVVGLGSPIPEPSTWAMLIAGFGLISVLGWRKRTARFAVSAAKMGN